MIWSGINNLQSHSYTCGYCGMPLASEKGWMASRVGGSPTKANPLGGLIYVCHHCSRPTFFDQEKKEQTPGVAFGKAVQNIPDASLHEIYDEARKATSAGCYTAAVLCCRKFLMHLAVTKGAKEGDSFRSYVEFLATKHLPPDCRPWIEQIKDIGNEANHEVKMMKQPEAENLVLFCEMLLLTLFVYPAAAHARNGVQAPAATT